MKNNTVDDGSGFMVLNSPGGSTLHDARLATRVNC